jgi:hypothetical protein
MSGTSPGIPGRDSRKARRLLVETAGLLRDSRAIRTELALAKRRILETILVHRNRKEPDRN